jgi:TPP-dependent pyruvate/acetoin dehydrogenase alpha subunit
MATRAKDRAAVVQQDGADQTPVQSVAPGNAISLLTKDKLKQLYACMLKCRMVEEHAASMSQEGRDGSDRRIGHEAIQVATTVDLQSEDTLAPSQRDLATEVMKGMPLQQIAVQVAGLRGKAGKTRGATKKGETALNVITPASAVDAQLSLATGVALGYKLLKRKNVVIALSGNDSSSIAIWHESLNFAGVHKLPIIYVIENDASMKSSEGVEELEVKTEGYRFPVITVDGSDVVAVYRVASEAISRARNGGGPTLIECIAHERVFGNSLRKVAFKDPLVHMERYLKKRNLWSDEWRQELVREFNRELGKRRQGTGKSFASRKTDVAPDRMHSFSIRDRELSTPR